MTEPAERPTAGSARPPSSPKDPAAVLRGYRQAEGRRFRQISEIASRMPIYPTFGPTVPNGSPINWNNRLSRGTSSRG
jgi:hypothetical protein